MAVNLVYIYAAEGRAKKKLLTALIEELQDNKEILGREAKWLESEIKKNLTVPYYSDSYIAARNAGILASLPKETRDNLMVIYTSLRYINSLVTVMGFGRSGYPKERAQKICKIFRGWVNDTDDLIKDLKKL